MHDKVTQSGLLRVAAEPGSGLLSHAGIVVNLEFHRVLRDGAPVHMGPTEFKLLCALMERPGRVFTRAELREAVWGGGLDIGARTIDVYIRRLRKALNRADDADPIRTVRSAGYALDEFAQSRIAQAS